MYNEKVMEHFRDPSNMGEIENPDVKIRVGNPSCGDLMDVYVNIGEEDDELVVSDIKFKTFGCGAAIATSSVATELVMGKSIDFAEDLVFDDIAEALGGLPKIKMHCSQLASIGIHEAIYQYRKENGMEVSEKLVKSHEKAVASLEATEDKHQI